MPTDADTGTLRPVDHDRGVPANVSADSLFDNLVAGEVGFVRRTDGVDVVRLSDIWDADVQFGRVALQFQHQEPSTGRSQPVHHGVERLEPFGSLRRIDVHVLMRHSDWLQVVAVFGHGWTFRRGERR